MARCRLLRPGAALLLVVSSHAVALAASTDAPSEPSTAGVQVVARTTAQIGAPMSGQLIDFPLADGDTFEAGQILAGFNCAAQEANVARARAELDKRSDLLATQQSLKALNAYSKADYRSAVNDVAVSRAELRVAQTAVTNCVVRAPFAGRVADIAVHKYQFMQIGAPLMDILDDRDLELELVVPSRWLSWVTAGTRLRARISETQSGYDARITRLSGRVDAASQTIKVYARLDGPAGSPSLLPGMSGSAVFPDAPK